MQQLISQRLLLALLLVLAAASPACAQKRGAAPAQRTALWLDPGNISSRNLLYGPGGKSDEPKGPMKFQKEEAGGSSPKFNVKDADGNKWKAKLSVEARPETVANRLLWAVGYFGNEDYFFPNLKVEGLPPKLKRGQNYVSPGGVVHNVRLQRHPEENEKRTGNWDWRQNPFYGTIDFDFPKRPSLVFLLSAPRAFCYYGREIRWMGKHIPRADAKWIGGLL